MTPADPARSASWLETCLTAIPSARVAVFGDFCLDAYWLLQTDEDELSLETGLPVRRVQTQRYSLGGAGNVVANLAALGVRQIRAIGLIGADLFGHHALGLLRNLGVDASGLFTSQADWQTLVYAKPCLGDVELNRIDFGGFNAISESSIDRLAAALDAAANSCDVVILNQQVPAGVSTAAMIERLNAIIARHSQCRFIVDSRDRAQLYRGAILKLNAHEALRLAGKPWPPGESVSQAEAEAVALELYHRTRQLVLVTRGARGLLAADDKGVYDVPGIELTGPTDPVGAGDTTVAALAAVIGAGGDGATAARFANIAASITVKKLQTTGTATPEEIRAVGPEPDLVHNPELAADPNAAQYVAGTTVEMIREFPRQIAIKHAVFDHDGTISTLREGWEAVMQPMMVDAILGSRRLTADKVTLANVETRVRELIEQTTGVQTLRQMERLVELVREFGFVPASEVLDIHAYKRNYIELLMSRVRQRVAKLQSGELRRDDFLVANAFEFLASLHSRGVKLYLASGTDVDDVIAEARLLGYAELFEGRIFGAVGDVKVEAKRVVLERIFREHALTGAEIVTLGDGPVEVRETRRRGGLTIGIASDEVRRSGLNPAKRSRLIRAGANVIVPDFKDLNVLLHLLGLE